MVFGHPTGAVSVLFWALGTRFDLQWFSKAVFFLSDRDRHRDDRKEEKTTPRKEERRASPPRRPPPEYSVHVPHHTLTVTELDSAELTRAYHNLFIPADFSKVVTSWTQVHFFPVFKQVDER